MTASPADAHAAAPVTPARWSPSVTVAAVIDDGVADPLQRRYLLVEEHTPEGLRLNNPAGHLDAGESLQQAVVRETLEETARPFTPTALVGVYLARFLRPASDGASASSSSSSSSITDVTYLRFAYAGTVGEPLPGRTLDTGIVRTLWLSLAELRASRALHRSPLVLQCIEDHLAEQRYPLNVVAADTSVWQPEPKS
ncbi:MAG: NUDIX hydrolase [Rubrivivax sp.]|nr:NUDIX hydrolase [Rubrivivax sp.]